jgi:hypothetical protein
MDIIKFLLLFDTTNEKFHFINAHEIQKSTIKKKKDKTETPLNVLIKENHSGWIFDKDFNEILFKISTKTNLHTTKINNWIEGKLPYPIYEKFFKDMIDFLESIQRDIVNYNDNDIILYVFDKENLTIYEFLNITGDDKNLSITFDNDKIFNANITENNIHIHDFENNHIIILPKNIVIIYLNNNKTVKKFKNEEIKNKQIKSHEKSLYYLYSEISKNYLDKFKNLFNCFDNEYIELMSLRNKEELNLILGTNNKVSTSTNRHQKDTKWIIKYMSSEKGYFIFSETSKSSFLGSDDANEITIKQYYISIFYIEDRWGIYTSTVNGFHSVSQKVTKDVNVDKDLYNLQVEKNSGFKYLKYDNVALKIKNLNSKIPTLSSSQEDIKNLKYSNKNSWLCSLITALFHFRNAELQYMINNMKLKEEFKDNTHINGYLRYIKYALIEFSNQIFDNNYITGLIYCFNELENKDGAKVNIKQNVENDPSVFFNILNLYFDIPKNIKIKNDKNQDHTESALILNDDTNIDSIVSAYFIYIKNNTKNDINPYITNQNLKLMSAILKTDNDYYVAIISRAGIFYLYDFNKIDENLIQGELKKININININNADITINNEYIKKHYVGLVYADYN